MPFKSVNVLKERLRNCQKLEETNEIRCLNATFYPGLILEQKKDISEKAGEIQIKSVIYLLLLSDVHFLS